MKFFIPSVFVLLLLAGMSSSCKHNPVVPGPDTTHKKDTVHCDTCHLPCDTCKKDTTTPPNPGDTTSHNFTWTTGTIPGNYGQLYGCWVFSANSIYVVGSSVYKTTDGKNWTDVTPTDRGHSLENGLSGFTMFAFSENDYWLTYAGLVYHVVGGIAQDYEPDSVHPKFTYSAWGMSSSDMYVVAGGGGIYHFDGTNWTAMSSGTTQDLGSIWGTSDQNIWACGISNNGQTALVHYDGTSWSEDPLDITGSVPNFGLLSVWASDSLNHRIVATTRINIYRKTDNLTWRNDSGMYNNRLPDSMSFVPIGPFSGNSSNDLFIAGDWGWTAHWNGKSYFQYTQLFNPNIVDFDGTSCSFRGNTVCIAGSLNGNAWYAIGQR